VIHSARSSCKSIFTIRKHRPLRLHLVISLTRKAGLKWLPRSKSLNPSLMNLICYPLKTMAYRIGHQASPPNNARVWLQSRWVLSNRICHQVLTRHHMWQSILTKSWRTLLSRQQLLCFHTQATVKQVLMMRTLIQTVTQTTYTLMPITIWTASRNDFRQTFND